VLDPAEADSLREWAATFPSEEERQHALSSIERPISAEDVLNSVPDPEWVSQSRGFELLVHCVLIASADGHIDSNERNFLIHLGKMFRFEKDFVEMLIREREETNGTV
jgi:hypothetical protein